MVIVRNMFCICTPWRVGVKEGECTPASQVAALLVTQLAAEWLMQHPPERVAPVLTGIKCPVCK